MEETDSREPLYFTLGEAARTAGVSKPTLSKAVKEGRLSAEKQLDGSYRIQPAELFRVYPPETAKNRLEGTGFDATETPDANPLISQEVAQLREQLAILGGEREREREQLTSQITDLRRRLDEEASERRKLTAILTDQRQPKAPDLAPLQNAGGFWRLFRRRG
jgi:excisionase family DNA binding protein